MSITQSTFGQLSSGEEVSIFTLTNANGLRAEITNYGGIVVGLHVPDRNGALADIVLGKDSLQDYLDGHPCFGTINGRVAGRIGGASFSIDGVEYILAKTDEPNCLHGGEEGFDKMLWDASIVKDGETEKLQLSLVDPDGHNNFPGTVNCTVTYALLDDNSLEITYNATTDKDTPLNLTNHSYFNLAGHDSGNVLDHEVQIFADSIAAVDDDATLLGRKDPLENNYTDLNVTVRLADLKSLDRGNADIHYNHPAGRTTEPKQVAAVYEPKSGRYMEAFTNEPGVQFYASLYLGDNGIVTGKGGCTYPATSGLCLETQDYADSINYPEMGGAILKAGEVFKSTTVYKFSTRD